MYDPISVEKFQALQQSVRKTPNESYAESLEVVLFNQLVQIHTVCVCVRVMLSNRVNCQQSTCMKYMYIQHVADTVALSGLGKQGTKL